MRLKTTDGPVIIGVPSHVELLLPAALGRFSFAG